MVEASVFPPTPPSDEDGDAAAVWSVDGKTEQTK